MIQILEQRYPLGFFPTPFHPLKRLSEKYSSYSIFIKRDDQTGLATGGNKTRKLEYLLYEAVKQGADTVITAGAQQSNHCRQTAAACAVAGLECHLLLGGESPKVYDGNLLLSKMLGAHIHFTGEKRKGEDIPVLKEKLQQKGKRVYVVPYGGSNVTGALGYVNAVKELSEQLEQQAVKPDYIFFASSSGATQAGMMVGMKLFGVEARLIPVNIDKIEQEGTTVEGIVSGLIGQLGKKLNVKLNDLPGDVPLNRNYDAPGYGNVTEGERNAVLELASTEGILLDPVYTGRAFYALIDHLQKELIPKGSKVLFWHTGGLPANFYYKDKLT